MVSLIVLTYNEEVHLGRCLESVSGLATDIFVVDSFSTDSTVEVARRYGAQVVQRAFVNQAEQFNWALDHLPLTTAWLLRLDADEYLTPELKKELEQRLPTLPDEITGLYVKRRFIFLNRWIRYGGYYPTWLLRVFRPGMARLEDRRMDEHMVLLKGKSDKLENDIVDHNHKGLFFWVTRQLHYATREVGDLVQSRQPEEKSIKAGLTGPQESRKRWLKVNIFYKFPLFLRAFFYFLYRYLFRLGFLDGIPGFIFHFLHACWYRFMVDALIYEQRLTGRNIAGTGRA